MGDYPGAGRHHQGHSGGGYGAPQYGAPAYGAPAYGAPPGPPGGYSAPSYGAPPPGPPPGGMYGVPPGPPGSYGAPPVHGGYGYVGVGLRGRDADGASDRGYGAPPPGPPPMQYDSGPSYGTGYVFFHPHSSQELTQALEDTNNHPTTLADTPNHLDKTTHTTAAGGWNTAVILPPLKVAGQHLQDKPSLAGTMPVRVDTIPRTNINTDSSRGMLRLVRTLGNAHDESFRLCWRSLCSEAASAAAVLWPADAGWTSWAAAAAVFPVFAVYGKQEGFVCESAELDW